MSTTQDLVLALKTELRTAGMTYADLATALGMSESSVKRVFAKADMPLSRIDEILRVLKMDFAELARKVVDTQPLAHELTEQQEAEVVADRRLLLQAICCLSQWSFEEMTREYVFSDAECIKYMARLDHLGIIELRPLNRYRLKVSKGFRWLPHGAVMRYFREHVAADYLSGGFDGDGELIVLVHGQITKSLAAMLVERLQRVGQDFARGHVAEHRLPDEQRESYALLVGMRTWLFAAFRDLPQQPHRGRSVAATERRRQPDPKLQSNHGLCRRRDHRHRGARAGSHELGCHGRRDQHVLPAAHELAALGRAGHRARRPYQPRNL